jgi:outer membrane protein assembly factor BamB
MELSMEIKSSADRLAPPDVPPIYHGGVIYSQDEDGPGGLLLASDEDTGKPLWTLRIYDVDIDESYEADAQWVFFAAMTLDADGRLRIVNVAGKTFLVDVTTRQIAAA